MRGYRPPPAPPVVMAEIPPVAGVADLEARLKRRLDGDKLRGLVIAATRAITLSEAEGALRAIAAGHAEEVEERRGHHLTARATKAPAGYLVDALGAAGCLTIGPQGSTLTAAGHAILAEIDARRGRGAA